MMNKRGLDERQLWIRGDIFKHGFFLMSGLLILYAMLSDMRLFQIEGMWSYIVIMMISFSVCIIEKICRDAYDTSDKRMTFLISAMGVLGLIELITGIVDLVSEGDSIMVNSTLSQEGVFLLESIILISIFCVFIVKRIISKRKIEEE